MTCAERLKALVKQLPLPGITVSGDKQSIVNVASVQQRSPFRYPGGKTWLVPRLHRWLRSMDTAPKVLIEPFAGGAIAGLTAAFDELAEHTVLVELDEQVAAVWKTIIENGDGPWLAAQIMAFDLTQTNVDNLLSQKDVSLRQRAFQVVVKNRVNRGGILAVGAGRVKYGEQGRGIASRWYPQTLARRILDIDQIRHRLTFIQGDGIKVIRQHSNHSDTVFFVDPPYTASEKRPGSRLYDCSKLDHTALFDLLAHAAGDFLMTYDDHPHIRELAQCYGFDVEAVPMKNTHHAQLTELLIGRSLTWVRE